MTPPFPPEEPLRLQQHVPGAHIQGYPTEKHGGRVANTLLARAVSDGAE